MKAIDKVNINLIRRIKQNMKTIEEQAKIVFNHYTLMYNCDCTFEGWENWKDKTFNSESLLELWGAAEISNQYKIFKESFNGITEEI